MEMTTELRIPGPIHFQVERRTTQEILRRTSQARVLETTLGAAHAQGCVFFPSPVANSPLAGRGCLRHSGEVFFAPDCL